MKQKRAFATHLILAVALLAGCNSYKSKQGPQSETVLPQSIDFQFVQAKVFAPRCYQCHSDAKGNDGDVNVETYENVMAHLDGIRHEALVSRTMPTKKGGGPLTEFEAEVLRLWIEDGAQKFGKPEPGAAPTPQPTPEPTPGPTPEVTPTPVPSPIDTPVAILPTWLDIHEKIFVPKCIQCHSAGGRAEDIPLDSKDYVTDPNNLLVTAGVPDESELFLSITKVGKGQMPPVKSGLTLSASDIDVIRVWILNGAKD